MNIEIFKNLNLTQIKGLIRSAGKHIRSAWKNISVLPYAKVYFAAVPLMILIFTSVTFPLEVLVKNSLHSLEGSAFRSIQSGDMSIGLFRDWEIESLSIVTNSKSNISFTNVFCDFSTFSLFSKTVSGTFSIEQFRYATDSFTALCSLKNGESSVMLDPADIPFGGKLRFTLDDIGLKGFVIQGFNIPEIKAGTIKAAINFSPKLMTIQDCTISGKDLSGKIRGTIMLDANMQRSQLNIICEINAKSPLLADYKLLLGSYINPDTDTLSISITGPLSNLSTDFVGAHGGQGNPPPDQEGLPGQNRPPSPARR